MTIKDWKEIKWLKVQRGIYGWKKGNKVLIILEGEIWDKDHLIRGYIIEVEENGNLENSPFKGFKTKKQAIAYAKAYMRKN